MSFGSRADVVVSLTRASQTATIASGGSVSGSIDLMGAAMIGFVTPSAWTSAALTIEVSDDNVNWSSAYDAYGAQVGSIASPIVSSRYAVDMQSLLPWRYVRLRSGTSSTPVVQDADRAFTVIARVLA